MYEAYFSKALPTGIKPDGTYPLLQQIKDICKEWGMTAEIYVYNDYTTLEHLYGWVNHLGEFTKA